MPNGYFTLDQLAKAAPTVRSDSPLDSTEPKIEPEEPRDDYHKDWGFYAFLYESPETLAAGGLTSLVPIGFGGALTLASPDVWQVPNLDLAGGDVGAPEPPAPEQENLFEQLCTPARMAGSAVLQEICMQLASDNACNVLFDVFPFLTSAPSSFTGAGAMNFPGGASLQFENFGGAEFCFGGSDIKLARATGCLPSGSCVECQAFYFSKPKSHTFDEDGKVCGIVCGPNDACVYRDFTTAMNNGILECLKTAFEDDFSDLGCVAA